MTALLIRDAAILTAAGGHFIGRGHVAVQDGRILSVAAGDAAAMPGAAIIDGRGLLVTPGLVNAHTHSQSATLPGFGDRLNHARFMWLTQAHTARRTPAEIRLAVMLTAWGALTTGTTAVIDHFPGQRFTAADLEAVLSAWHETGMRATVGIRFFNAPFADIIPASGAVPIAEPQTLDGLEAMIAAAMKRWHGRDGRIGVFPAPSSPDRCTDAALVMCAGLAARYDTGIHTHLLETAVQARQARERHGVSTVGRLRALGVLSERWSCAHCIWLDAADIAAMAAAGAIAVLNPESNARIGAGTADIPGLRAAGVRLALGTDGVGANDNLSMHEAMRAAATLHRAVLADPRDWVSAADALAMATAGGAAALRYAKLGAVAPGYPADLVLYRLDRPAWVPLNDPVNQLVFAETGSAVDTVIVAGEVLLAGGRPTRFDPAALSRAASAMAAELRRRNADLITAADLPQVAPNLGDGAS